MAFYNIKMCLFPAHFYIGAGTLLKGISCKCAVYDSCAQHKNRCICSHISLKLWMFVPQQPVLLLNPDVRLHEGVKKCPLTIRTLACDQKM